MSILLAVSLRHVDRPNLLTKLARAAPCGPQFHRQAHTVRVIVRQDIPPKAYEGDIVHVKAGYARNYLLPHKKAVYATRQNFEKLGMTDPELETPEQKRERTLKQALAGEDLDLKAADVLKHYLRNKVLKLKRNVDASTNSLTNGSVDAKYVKKKLSKQLKIDLEPHESVHLRPDAVRHADLDQNAAELQSILDSMSLDQPCNVQVNQLGEYIACISLRGGFRIPLKVQVNKR